MENENVEIRELCETIDQMDEEDVHFLAELLEVLCDTSDDDERFIPPPPISDAEPISDALTGSEENILCHTLRKVLST